MLRRSALALLLLVLALHPLAHEEELSFGGPEPALTVDVHELAECPCIRGGATGVAAPELTERLAITTHHAEVTRDGYTSAKLAHAVPSRAPPAIG
jgi:hypothetical protein